MAEVIVEPLALQRTSGGNVTGPIHFVVDGRFFPERGWNDFPVTIVGWWLEAISRLQQGQSMSEDLDFMDGPYLVQLTLNSAKQVALEYRADRGHCSVEASESASLQHLADAILVAGVTLSEACLANDWCGGDADLLRRAIGVVQELST